MVAQVGVERRLVAQAVLDDAPDTAFRSRVVAEDLRRQEPVELQHVRDVVAQPGVERALDGGVRVEVDLVQDGLVVVVGCHGARLAQAAAAGGFVTVLTRRYHRVHPAALSRGATGT